MNESQKTDIKKFLDKSKGDSKSRDISDNLLMAKLLGQRSKEDHSAEMKEQAENKITTEFIPTNSDLVKKLDFNMWHSVGPIKIQNNEISYLDGDESVHRTHSEEFLSEKSEKVYELLSQFKTDSKETASKKFLAMSSSPENCIVLRQSGCLPLLIQLIHGPGSNRTVREHASQALHSIVQHNADEKQSRREGRILNLIEQLLEYCDDDKSCSADTLSAALCTLMKFSFDMEQRHTMCQFGALHALAKVIQVEHARIEDVNSLTAADILVRRYAAMSLTNLTCGDSTNKALLCSMKPFMFALVAQLQSSSEELCQVTAGVLRNLSWRADTHIKETLHQIDATKRLMETVMRVHKEPTLRAILAALWNLTAHGDVNKMDICNVDNAIEFLVKMLTYQAPSNSVTVIENIGGILRNISKLIAVRDDYRAILRNHNCLPVLLQQLKSPSLVIVGNACGTLWNLTARSTEDQRTLIQLGAVDMLRSLTHSKHKMISVSATAALKNLMSCPNSTSSLEACKTNTLSARKRVREHFLTGPETVLANPARSNADQSETGLHRRMNGHVGDDDEDKTNSFRKVEEPYNVDDSFNDYTGTNLDEPTNYSLKFSEHVIDTTTAVHPPTIINAKTNDEKVPLSNEKTPLETPLMFSRSSSIDSISISGELIDDQASVVSECSRAVSGIVTPSDLPDSPSQTVPPTPRPQPRDKMNTFSAVVSKDLFEDEVTVFKDECTPITFSVATSLSSLNFEDDECVAENRVLENKLDQTYAVENNADQTFSVEIKLNRSCVVENQLNHTYIVDSNLDASTAGATSSDTTGHTVTIHDEDKDDSLEVDLSLEEQQAILEACIVSGKPSSVLRGNSSIKNKTSDENVTISSRGMQDSVSRSAYQSTSLTDSTVNYCTEDTPICISHAASNSDLSLLCPSEDSFLQNSMLPLSSCLDSVELLPDEQESLLDQCIAIGKRTLSFNSNQNSLEDIKSSQSSTLSEITEDLPVEDRTLIKDITANGNLISSMMDVDDEILNDMNRDLSEKKDKNSVELLLDEQESLLDQCIAIGKRTLSFNSNPNSLEDNKSLQSSTVSEITDDLLLEDRTLIKDMTANANLISSMTVSSMSGVDDGVLNDMSRDLSEEEEKNLLNQCIALGMRSMKDSSDLENIGPPSFLAEANLDSSLTNVEEITDYAPNPVKFTPNQKRRQIKERYNTYTLKQTSPTKTLSLASSKENTNDSLPERSPTCEERRIAAKDRFKTRTISKDDFEEIVRCQNKSKPVGLETELSVQTSVAPQRALVSSLHRSDDSSTTSDAEESSYERVGAKIVKPVVMSKAVKSGIPIVHSKIPKTKSSAPTKRLPPSELPVSLQRQNTFTKEESSSIPIRKDVGVRAVSNSSSKTTTPTSETAAAGSVLSPPFKSGIPSRISSIPKMGGKVNDLKSPDIVKNHRWSMSENNLNAPSTFKKGSNTSLNNSTAFSSTPSPLKGNPSASQSALPVRRESSVRNTAFYAYK